MNTNESKLRNIRVEIHAIIIIMGVTSQIVSVILYSKWKISKTARENCFDALSLNVFVTHIYWPQCATKSFTNAKYETPEATGRKQTSNIKIEAIFALATTFIAYAAHCCRIESKGENAIVIIRRRNENVIPKCTQCHAHSTKKVSISEP